MKKLYVCSEFPEQGTVLANSLEEAAESLRCFLCRERDECYCGDGVVEIKVDPYWLEKIGMYKNKNTMLEAEIDTLHEKHRWRKQSEEPLPNSEDSFLVFAKGCAVMIQGRELYAPNVTNRDGIYWRPLDLPGTEVDVDE